MKWQSAPRQLNYRNVLESWELRIIECEVSTYCGHGKAFPEDEREDVIQELVIRWVSERDKWRADRKASRQTFMRAVVRNDLRDLAEGRQAQKRRTLDRAVSLHEPADDDPDGPLLEEVLPDEKAADDHRIGRRVDLARALGELTSRERQVADLLTQGYTVTAAADRLGLARSTVSDEVARIRQLFERRGLRKYFKKGSDTSE